mgnify:CR=1 FL=1
MPLDITPGGASSDSYASIETINAYAVKHGASFPITGSDGPSTAAAIAAAEAAAFVDSGTGGEIVTMTIPAR